MDESGGEIHKVYKNAFILWSISVNVNGLILLLRQLLRENIIYKIPFGLPLFK